MEKKRIKLNLKGIFPFFVFLIIIFFLTIPSYAQFTFNKSYGGIGNEEGWSAQPTFDGGYILVGWTDSFGAGNKDIYLVKTDTIGETLWTNTYGGLGDDEGYSVQQTLDGGYIIAGKTNSFGAGLDDVYLIKTNSSGTALWTFTYGGTNIDEGWSVKQTNDGGYIVSGATQSFGAGGRDFYLVKTNALGGTLWTKTYGGGANEWAGYSVQQTSDWGYIIAGETNTFGAGQKDVYLVKTDTIGDTLWTKTYGGIMNDVGWSVEQISGGYIITGKTSSSGAGFDDIYLVKTNSTGDSLWALTYGGAGFDEGRSVKETTDLGYIIVGTSNSGGGQNDVYIVKTDASGITQWTQTYGQTFIAHGQSVEQTMDGGYILTGFRGLLFGTPDAFLIKTDGNGMVLGIEEEESVIRDQFSVFRLYQNLPNPFHTFTHIRYSIPSANPASSIPHHVSLNIYDLTGKLVETLVEEKKEMGVYEVEWEGKNLTSGIYFYRLKSGNVNLTRKMVLLK
jgi:hypothetical protein